MAASRSDSVGDARDASSHMRIPMRTARSGPRASSPWLTSSATSRDAVATCRPARRAISDTGRAGSSGVKQSRIRTARASEDSPVAVRAMPECGTGLSSIERLFRGSHPSGATLPL